MQNEVAIPSYRVKTTRARVVFLNSVVAFSIGLPDPIEAIKFRMEQLNYSQNDLANIVGLKSRASEILNRKRKLTLEMIRQLHTHLNIPMEVLVRAY